MAYMFFIVWRVVVWVQVAEFVPLYLLLVLAALPGARTAVDRLALWAKNGRRITSRAGA